MTLLLIICFFFLGYFYSKWKSNKNLEAVRLAAIKAFITSYCQKLREMCDSMMEKVKDPNLKDEEKTIYAPMLSVISNVHDELVDIWEKEGEERLETLLQNKVSDRHLFGQVLDKKMTKLVDFEDGLSAEDGAKALHHIAESRLAIDELKTWLNNYTEDRDHYIKTLAIEARALLTAKEEVLKIIAHSVKTSENAPEEAAQTALATQALYAERYTSAMRLLAGS